MNVHLKGLLLTTLGVLLIVPDSLFVRLIVAEPMVTTFWRSLISGLAVLIFVVAFHGLGPFRAIFKSGRAGAIYTLLMATTSPAFVLAVTNTSVANVVFIFATMPIFAALFSRIFLSEPIQMRMVLTMVGVLFGLAIIAIGSQESDIASWKGDLWALYASAAYAAALTTLRRLKNISMIPAIPIAYIGAACVIAWFTSPLAAFEANWPLLLAHGAFIGAATCLLTLGPRYISSTEVSLLVLLESVLAPILVWMVVGENPGYWAISGGVIVIGALLVSSLVALKLPQKAQ
jgi:drug/metabolite transporter (DMT)-like permease